MRAEKAKASASVFVKMVGRHRHENKKLERVFSWRVWCMSSSEDKKAAGDTSFLLRKSKNSRNW
jgi:hypothetical protein